MSIIKQIENTMRRNKGKIYTISDFEHLGNRNTVKSALSRLANDNKIARLIDGYYTKLEYFELVKEFIYPTVEDLAVKIAKENKWEMTYAGNSALNYTGVSTQVPLYDTYAITGESREYSYIGQKVIFQKTANQNIMNLSKPLALMVQAIIALGREKVEEEDIKNLARYARIQKINNLSNKTKHLSVWIRDVFKKVDKALNG